MGYITEYNLEVVGNNSIAIIDDLRKSNSSAYYSLDKNGYSGERSKWYDAKKDITEFSKKYPDNLFILRGNGEESEDIWKFYAKNGKSKERRLTFEPFDESMLV